ncbi:uncharacterized protein LOC8272156 isoform X1 [Ricinus communis]|uniref:Enhancer of polycomb-like protein n=1 Tax=Ricinus communis TaxID=3988 RepID=B9RS85_RICCO|nr:uncharacterized protein LOC8272156 isoform X1 [Ricinus communis]EEF45945.1 hypothetical protein RCOM_0804080 [Ricinus communis]|eukprot:XP_002516604.1 uncharacterized protein LOC8272355 [Ricinus communis]
MENRIGNSHEAEIPKKSRSLDLRSLYQSSEGSKEAQIKNLKRKGGSDVDNSGFEKRKKSRKAVSISSFRKVNGNGSKSLEEVYNGSLSSGSHDTKEIKSGSLNQQRVNNSNSGVSKISQNLEGSFDKIPRRKRGFVGRKKVEKDSQVLKPAEESRDKLETDQISKLTVKDTGKVVESSKVKQKKVSDDFKENRISERSSGRHCEEDGHTGHSVARSVVLSLWKSQTGHSVEIDDDSSKKKSLRKRSRKRKNLISEDKSVAKEAEPSVDAEVSCDLHDDDEENLEENAARMLSSRFDTSCTGFSSNSKASPVPSTNGLSFLLSSGQEFATHGPNYISGSESASLDAAARILRPRKQHKEKGSSRKRRHYYEIFSGDLDAYWVLNRRIKVFWPLDQSWYYGLVNDYDNVRKLHHVKYDDRDEEWINLQDERFKLLLLPSEVPGKPQRKRSRTKEKISKGGKGKLKPSKEKRDSTIEDDSYVGNYMDSEPIISWLARSTHRVKSSPLRALKKQKVSGISLTSAPSLLPEEAVCRNECSEGDLLSRDKSNLSGNSALPGRFTAGGRDEVPDISPKDNKLPVVYYRRRFRCANSMPRHASEDNHVSIGVPESDTSLVPAVYVSRAFEKQDISLARVDPDSDLGRLDTAEALWLSDVRGLLRLNTELVEPRQFRFGLRIPVLSVHNFSFISGHTWFCNALLLLQHGRLMTTWPRVHLEMLFVDNIVGLRFLLFEGCLKQAIAFVLQVLTVFHQPTEHGKFVDLQLPVTSIKFKFSCIQDFRKQLVFAFYNFSELKNSKWMHLDSRLKRHCLLTKQLPLSECTYDNVKALQNGTSQLLDSSVCRDSARIKGPVKRFRQCVSLMGVSRDSNYVNSPSSSSRFDKSHGWFPPFALSFTAAPTFFLSLHLKLLMEHSVTHISFQDHDSVEHPENSGSLQADDCYSVDDSLNKHAETTPDNNSKGSSRDVDCEECLFCANTEPLAVGVSVNTVGDWMKPSPKHQNSDVHAETSAFSKDSGELGRDIASLQKWRCHHSEAEQNDALPKPSVDRALLNGIRVEIPSSNQFDKQVDKDLDGAQQSTDLSWNMNGGIIPSPNPTARRSTWHRNRSNLASVGYNAHGWSDGRGDFLQNNFRNGPKKPRTQVSYALPFGAFDYSSKSKGHSQKGIPHKRIRTANEKRSSDVSRGSERNLELLSCEANVLITLGDKGWREYGAQVVLELSDHNEWKLAVKLSGTTKYSYKAHQFLQPGSTNRYTHAMMWKGGKDWILEFSDRSQWALFKEMHEECYNRNIHAASVKNIPIPGVRLIEEHDDNGIEVPFIRHSSKYFRQVETDVEMALNPSRLLYDIDSDDEQWISNNLSSLEVFNSNSWEISEEIFEKTMDLFEKAAYSQHRDQFTSDEIEELMAGVGSMEAIKVIHDYWQQKRQRKGMPLIRHLQPPLWERYQQQVREWELKMTKSNTALLNGCHKKGAPIEKPPMFAFCLKPRGLELPNRGSKQRAQRKVSITGQRNTLLGDHDSFHAYGRRSNGFASGDEKVLYQGHNYEPLDDSPLSQISPRVFSPRDAGGKGYYSVSSDRYERNHIQKLHRSKSRKPGAYVFPHDTQMVAAYDEQFFDKRNGFHRWNMGFSEWPSQRHYYLDGAPSHCPKQFNYSDLDEFRLRDASGAAQYARNMAKLKREKAQRLLYRADLAIHKAVVALMTAEAIKVSSEDLNSDG